MKTRFVKSLKPKSNIVKQLRKSYIRLKDGRVRGRSRCGMTYGA
jgi:hypothetical protein